MTPDIARLPSDPSPLLAGCAAAAKALEEWRGEHGELLEQLAGYGSGASLADCPRLGDLFERDESRARKVVLAAIAPMLAVLREHVLAQLPQRHFSNGVLHSVTLAVAVEASLSLALIDAAGWRAAQDPRRPATASFQGGELHTRILAGAAEARRVRIVSAGPRAAELVWEALPLTEGAVYQLDGAREALVFDSIEHSVVSLRLHRQANRTAPARQYDLATGALVHQAAADQRDSRMEMLMALLRRMERADAAPVLAELAREGAPASRWQALRECLALDSATGLRELAAIAARPGDALQAPARNLLDSLSQRDPAFARAREEMLCPA